MLSLHRLVVLLVTHDNWFRTSTVTFRPLIQNVLKLNERSVDDCASPEWLVIVGRTGISVGRYISVHNVSHSAANTVRPDQQVCFRSTSVFEPNEYGTARVRSPLGISPPFLCKRTSDFDHENTLNRQTSVRRIFQISWRNEIQLESPEESLPLVSFAELPCVDQGLQLFNNAVKTEYSANKAESELKHAHGTLNSKNVKLSSRESPFLKTKASPKDFTIERVLNEHIHDHLRSSSL